jgi:hypothetical protein
LNPEKLVQLKQWAAHKQGIVSMKLLDEPLGLITCSIDKHVKIWSLKGELWGDIYLLKESYDKKWAFPFEWKKKQ